MRRSLLLLLAALVVPIAVLTGAVKKNVAVSRSDAAKADLLCLEALNRQMNDEHDAALELLSRAHELNPDEPFIASEYGLALIRANGDDREVADKGYLLMKQYLSTPEGNDYYNRARMAQIAAMTGRDSDNLALMRGLYEDFPDRPEVARAYADRLIASRRPENLDKVLEVFDSLEIREGGVSIPLTMSRIGIYGAKSDTLAMIREMRRALAELPPSPEICLLAGNVFEMCYPVDTALAYYDRAVEIDPESAGVSYYYKANLLLNRGDSIGYDREIFKALSEPDLDVDTKVELLQSYVSNLYTDPKQKPRIIEIFRNILEQHPHEAEIHGFFSDYLAMAGEYEEAVEQATLALDLNPADQRRWRLLASLYMSLEDYENAVESSLKGLRYFPDDEDLPILAATAYGERGHTVRAFELLLPLAESSADDPERQSEIYSTMGDVFYRNQLPDSAFVYYGKAIAINPDNLLALNNCAYYLACEGQELDRALRMIEKVVDRKPQDPTSLDTYAWVLFKMRNYEKARETIDTALENLSDPTAEVLHHAGDIYFMCQMHDDALRLWEEALELEPDNELLQRKVRHKTYFPK